MQCNLQGILPLCSIYLYGFAHDSLINVISRNLLGGSIAWIEEISRYIFTWMMFMGIAIGVHYKKHLAWNSSSASTRQR